MNIKRFITQDNSIKSLKVFGVVLLSYMLLGIFSLYIINSPVVIKKVFASTFLWPAVSVDGTYIRYSTVLDVYDENETDLETSIENIVEYMILEKWAKNEGIQASPEDIELQKQQLAEYQEVSIHTIEARRLVLKNMAIAMLLNQDLDDQGESTELEVEPVSPSPMPTLPTEVENGGSEGSANTLYADWLQRLREEYSVKIYISS